MNDMELLSDRIKEIKAQRKRELIILTHHYQRKEVVDLGDVQGDSFALSQRAASDKQARYIVFCGVHFMAESAAILAQPHQIVQIPDEEAGCWMADMADIVVVGKAWEALSDAVGADSITPMVYMNSDAGLKAFCGRHGGIVCTSSNAPEAFKWAFRQREKIFFFPDQHLGRNTGNKMGIPSDEMIVWDPEKPLGGHDIESIQKAKVILWDGYCLVHTRFKTTHISKMRARIPQAKIVVHPECTEEVVALADAVGSTSFIVNYVREAPPGTTIAIGTEVNLVHRLDLEHPEKTVLPLHESLCPNMYKIDLHNLLWTLDNLGRVNMVTVQEKTKKEARTALERMLSLPH